MQNSWSTGIPQGPPPGMGQQGGSGGSGHWGGGGGGGGRSRGGMGGGHARNSRVFGGVQFQQGGHGAGYMQQSRMRKPNGYDEGSRLSILGGFGYYFGLYVHIIFGIFYSNNRGYGASVGGRILNSTY